MNMIMLWKDMQVNPKTANEASKLMIQMNTMHSVPVLHISLSGYQTYLFGTIRLVKGVHSRSTLKPSRCQAF